MSPSELTLLRLAAADPAGAVPLHQARARDTAKQLIRFGFGEMDYGQADGVDRFVISDRGKARIG